MIEYSAGIVTAYGSAVRAGYTGTYEDFCRQQAQYAQNASAVEQAKQTAVSASQSADQAKQDAQTASTQAQSASQSAQSASQSAEQSAQDAQTAKNNAQTYAQSASQSAGSAQQSAQSAQAVLESIPEDYSDLSSDVDQLKADLADVTDSLEDSDFKDALWYQGGIDNGSPTTATNRIHTDLLYVPKDGRLSILISSGFKYAISFYDESRQFIPSDSAWRTQSIANFTDYPTGTSFIAVAFAKTSNGSILPEEGNNVVLRMLYDIDEIERNARDIELLTDVIISNVDFLSNVTWEMGALDNGRESVTSNRIRTKFIEIGYSQKIEITKESGYMYALTFYDVDKRFISTDSAWRNTDILLNADSYPSGTVYMRIVLRNNKNTSMTLDDASNISGIITIFAKRGFDYLSTKVDAVIDYCDSQTEDSRKYADLISQARFSPTSNANVLTLMHFSDVHNNLYAMQKALSIYNTHSAKIDDMVHTGDVVTANYSDGLSNWINSGCAETVISVIGNHDSEENLVLGTAGKTTVYNGMLAPYIDNWGVVQPTGVDDSTSNYYCACYYYKDYADVSMRLVVLDTNWWDSYESAWLTEVLADALINGYAIILACHTPRFVTGITEANFCSYTEPSINESASYANIPNDWLDPVNDFILNGGEVVCMLAGHNHRDHIGYLTNYPNILCLTADKASISRTIDSARINGEDNATAFNIVTFNTTDKLIKIVRIGAEVDGQMRGKHVFCYDYANKRIISQW